MPALPSKVTDWAKQKVPKAYLPRPKWKAVTQIQNTTDLLGCDRRFTSPQTVLIDIIILFHYHDDSDSNNGMSFDLKFRFDDLLDNERLRIALSRLLELEGWRKLGARIRPAETGALGHHIPESFDSGRPGFAWSSATFDVAVDKYPQASRLTHPHGLDAAGRPSVSHVPSCAASSDFGSFIRTPGFAQHLDDWLSSDSPVLGIHVIHFRDATLMTTSFLHSVTDMMGLKAVLEAWTAILRGEEDEVTPFMGFLDDVVGGLNKTIPLPQVRYHFEEMLLTGWKLTWFAAKHLLPTELFWSLREEELVVLLPAKYLKRMREQAMEELATQAPTADGEEASFVSEADIIFAWWTRIVLRAEDSSPSRTICLRNTCCCRPLLAELNLIPSAASTLVTNAVFGLLTFSQVRQVLEQSLAATAVEIRRALIKQRTAEQLQALDAIERHHKPAIFGDAGMFLLTHSIWDKTKLFEVDFLPAVVRQGLGLNKRNSQLGRPSCVLGFTTSDYAIRNAGAVVGKDEVVNCWLVYSLRKRIWPEVERELLFMSA
ncbi:hypothetical protein DOTSEDRAFT_167955 [Dothistroma septosporum NZE10]|uniref:LysR family regulatory protein n=1 Tax=Dothistroma septosporum (strain NZE10 / CBS 128990) TaxID=675120 RepID=N1PZ25_DOTSN|nr:hypothetical protein DOTSEDRAFT_167955 [Dothistroma septosporum NZE10]